MIVLVGVRGKLDTIYFPIPVHYESNHSRDGPSLTTNTVQDKRDWLIKRITPDGLSSQPPDTLPQVLSPI